VVKIATGLTSSPVSGYDLPPSEDATAENYRWSLACNYNVGG